MDHLNIIWYNLGEISLRDTLANGVHNKHYAKKKKNIKISFYKIIRFITHKVTMQTSICICNSFNKLRM